MCLLNYDHARHRSPKSDTGREEMFSLEKVKERFEIAGLPRFQRYCAAGTLDAVKEVTATTCFSDRALKDRPTALRHG